MILPRDIVILLSECNEINAYYDPNASEVVICYELIEHITSLFQNQFQSEEELLNASGGAISFTLYHELGHALVDVYDLPMTGREEDAVDQFSTYILSTDEAGEDLVVAAALWFGLQGAQKTNIEELPFWGEHALDIQRFYNILCWVYGKNPQRHGYLVDDNYLPRDRAERCPSEYDKLSRSWGALLDPYLKD